MTIASVFLPGEVHGQRNLVGDSPWDHKESDMTEQMNRHTHLAWVENHYQYINCCISVMYYHHLFQSCGHC